MNCMLWPLVEWKTSLHLSKSLAFAHCQIKFAAPVGRPWLMLFSWHVARCVYAVWHDEYFCFSHRCYDGYSVSPGWLSRLFIIIVKLTLGDVPKSNLILNWQSEADTANLPANLICRDRERSLSRGNGRIIGLQTYCLRFFSYFSLDSTRLVSALHIAIWNIEKVLSPGTRVAVSQLAFDFTHSHRLRGRYSMSACVCSFACMLSQGWPSVLKLLNDFCLLPCGQFYLHFHLP